MSTIGKALTLLDTVSRLDQEAGLSDIARHCSLDKATARRFLVELGKHGFVEQDPGTKKYHIGPAPVRLARIREARYPFLRTAMPFIKELAENTMETVHISEFAIGRLATIHVEDSPRAHRVNVDVGIILPFHATASGLAFLASCPPQQVEALLSGPLDAYTEMTPTDPATIKAKLDEIRQQGYSVSNQGLEAGVVSTAAAIVAPDGHAIGTIAVAAPQARVDAATISKFGQAAAATADKISGTFFGLERRSAPDPLKGRRG